MESLKKELETAATAGIVEGVMEGMEGVCADFIVPEVVRGVKAAAAAAAIDSKESPQQQGDSHLVSKSEAYCERVCRVRDKKKDALHYLDKGEYEKYVCEVVLPSSKTVMVNFSTPLSCRAFESALSLDDDEFLMQVCELSDFKRPSHSLDEKNFSQEQPLSSMVLLNLILLLSKRMEQDCSRRIDLVFDACYWVTMGWGAHLTSETENYVYVEQVGIRA